MIEAFPNKYTKNVVAMLAVGDNKILTGDTNGDIRLWIITRYSDSYNFHCEHVFLGHLEKIHCLTLMSNNRFISSSADNTMRIWNIASRNCEKILEGDCKVLPSKCESIVALPDDLIAVAGYCSPGWGAFEIWDAKTGKCLFFEKALLHRPHGMSIAEVKGYLSVNAYCGYSLSIWKINRVECEKITECENERIYSMAASSQGEIITGGFNINIFKIFDDGTIQKFKSLQNTNVTDVIIPLGGYKVLTVDRQSACSGRLKLWNYLTGTDEVLGDSCTPSGQLAYGHIVLANDSIVLSINQGKFCIQQFSNLNNTSKDIAEIRKNSRLLAQAFRTKTSFFSQLPKELNIEIAALTSDLDDEKMARKISSDHFCKPNLH